MQTVESDPDRCRLCEQAQATGITDHPIDIGCWSCDGTFHIHRSQFEDLDIGTCFAARCPDCGQFNPYQVEFLMGFTLPHIARN